MKVINRTYSREYENIESFEAGVALTGGEVKMIQSGGLKLDGSFVRIIDDIPLLYNVEIPKYRYASDPEYDPRRTRKLLLKRDEIERLKTKIASAGGLTIIPVSCYNKRGKIKLEIALSRGRKDLEKRKREKQKDIDRAQEKEVKEYLKE
jgi:SsrA-binding protein